MQSKLLVIGKLPKKIQKIVFAVKHKKDREFIGFRCKQFGADCEKGQYTAATWCTFELMGIIRLVGLRLAFYGSSE